MHSRPWLCGQTIHNLTERLKGKYEETGKASPQNLSHLRRADRDLGHLVACAATPKRFREYRQQRREAGDAAASINRTLQMVRAAYRLAVKEGELARAPYIEMFCEADNVRQGFFEEQQIADVLAALPNDGLRDFVESLAACGERKGEAEKITWDMVKDNEIHLPPHIVKNRTGRVIPLGPELAVIVERRRAARGVEVNAVAGLSQYVFHRGDGKPVGDFKKSWATATKDANCAGFLVHDLRRTVARRLLAANIPQITAQKLLGHKTASMYTRYAGIVTSAEALAAQQTVAAFRKKIVIMK